MTGRALLGLALLVGLAAAQLSDSPEPQPAPVDGTAAPDTVKPFRPAKSPGKAALLSFLLPGAGQAYTGAWWKTAFIAPTEAALGYFSINEHLAATEAWKDGDTAGYVERRDRRTVLLWWTGAVIVFSMADAYVSAQMYGFDREMTLAIGPMRAGIAMEF